jgi:RNA polymerase sigma-70 factor (ECF subfamily)
VTIINEHDFEAERLRLTAIATRILGSSAEAEDVVQEAWIRFAGADTDDIDSLPAWLTRVVTRLCLDHLRKRRPRVAAEEKSTATPSLVEPETDAVLADRVGGAMQIVLDTLAPAERAAFVLHDVFGYPFDEISEVLGRSPAAVRQIASRARRKVQGAAEPAAERAARAESRQVIDAFLAAARGGQLDTMLALLDPNAVMHADAVGQQMGTDPRYEGAAAVAARLDGARGAAPVTIDGERAAAWIMAGEVKVAFIFHVENGRVREVELIADPEVLAMMDVKRVRRGAQ